MKKTKKYAIIDSGTIDNYVFTAGNEMYHDYVPENGHIAKPKQQSIAGFVQTICEITGNPSDYLFTDELFERYQQFGINNNCCRFTNIGEF
ncbi:hypothetical protein [uncultured Ruminococcus sp.]|uniref:hypothetical protein n=1 Tax=uncultured Ruminococcus sp. TaxID=165186 RepID=UPI002618D80A|nr:hypothetical protein [uncultured Ruminococcus sp.]